MTKLDEIYNRPEPVKPGSVLRDSAGGLYLVCRCGSSDWLLCSLRDGNRYRNPVEFDNLSEILKHGLTAEQVQELIGEDEQLRSWALVNVLHKEVP